MTLLRGALLLSGVHPSHRITGFTTKFPAFLSVQKSIRAAASGAHRSSAHTTRRWGAIPIEGAQA